MFTELQPGITLDRFGPDYFERNNKEAVIGPSFSYQNAEQQLDHLHYVAETNSSFLPEIRNYRTQFPYHRSLLASLREGGYILYTRHAEATVGADQPNLNFQDCSTQRNLSLIGRRQATDYGETIRRLAIPILAPVISSPFCRNIETASLAFGRVYIQVDPFLYDVYRLSTNISLFEQQRILATLNSLLEIPVPAGTNKVIIAHSFPEGIGLGRLPNMGTIVIRPRGYGMGFEVVAYLTLAELNRLT